MEITNLKIEKVGKRFGRYNGTMYRCTFDLDGKYIIGFGNKPRCAIHDAFSKAGLFVAESLQTETIFTVSTSNG